MLSYTTNDAQNSTNKESPVSPWEDYHPNWSQHKKTSEIQRKFLREDWENQAELLLQRGHPVQQATIEHIKHTKHKQFQVQSEEVDQGQYPNRLMRVFFLPLSYF